MIDTASYGKALFQLAQENGSDVRVLDELGAVQQLLQENPSYALLLDTPAVSQDEKHGLLHEAFGQFDPMLLNFLCLLCDRRAFYQLPACRTAYRACFDEAHDIVRAEAITAVPMQDKQRCALKAKLEALTGKNIVLKNSVDPALIGGITLRYGGVQLSDSIQSRLDRLRRSLDESIV